MYIWRGLTEAAMLVLLVLLGMAFIDEVYGDEFVGVSQNITTDFNGDRLHHLFATGIYYRVNSDCYVPDYASVVLHDTGYYGSGSVNYSGGAISKVYWKIETTTINSCTRDCNDEAITTNAIHWHNCDVTGVIGGKPTVVSCADNSPVFVGDTGLLFLKNIKLFEGLDDTLLRYNKAVLELEDGCFEVKQVE